MLKIQFQVSEDRKFEQTEQAVTLAVFWFDEQNKSSWKVYSSIGLLSSELVSVEQGDA